MSIVPEDDTLTAQRLPRRIDNGTKPYILSPKNDYVFRFLFGEEGNEELLTSLLSAILGRQVHQATIKNPYLLKFYREKKEYILDIKAEIDNTILVDIEIQLTKSPELLNRILMYWSKLFGSQMKSGDGYHDMKKTISVLILDDDSYHSDEFHICSRIRDCILKYEMTDLLEMHILQMPKVHKQRDQDRNNTLIQWMNFLNAQTTEELIMAAEANPAIKKATDILTAMSRDEEERQKYEAREQFLFDQQHALQASKREGREEGIIKNKRETARLLIAEGMDDQFIIKITGLSQKEIDTLRNER